ncbi:MULTISPECIES: hypothetical protein [Streptomyces]|uniref:hypothetical protein n=1 Tax=Streptomyces TaxID=1883 RepID=UPI00163D2F3F|nr:MULTISPECIES: hypothetical protein [Streptomyces]MBC2879475.1 hypothetical protein [Streptomyces sp. TYQ1024]UBI35045.1 hypothetical protein K7I03_00300 [Streptomyces mobaraensis]UKW27640.1 hypothetical protein MCU78_00335 [Streptomyces sp. TYQ1024]UKW33358.1 hypothetical protein MCU78_32725 [Streptomyces sp. TYQ1024]
MYWITEEEEYVYGNSREGSDLWALLSDWSESEDEEEWERHVPLFAGIVSRWCRKGYIDVYEGPEPPAWMDGRRITGAELDRLLADPAAWRYREHPDSVFGLALGENVREIAEPPEPPEEPQAPAAPAR